MPWAQKGQVRPARGPATQRNEPELKSNFYCRIWRESLIIVKILKLSIKKRLVQRSVWPGGPAAAPAEGVGQGQGDGGSEASRGTGVAGEPTGRWSQWDRGAGGLSPEIRSPRTHRQQQVAPGPSISRSPGRPDPGGRPPAASTRPLPEREGGLGQHPTVRQLPGLWGWGRQRQPGTAGRPAGRRHHAQGPRGPMCTRLQKSWFSYRNLIVPKAEAASGELDE